MGKEKQMNYDITAVINLHTEAYLSKASLDSADRSVKFARSNGMTAEVIVILDSPDQKTINFVNQLKRKDWKILVTDKKDLGKARNFGVSKSRGDLVAFLDGDDIWCENWLFECVKSAKSATRKFVWHTDLNIYFGEDCRIFRHIDMENEDFDLLHLLFSNFWTSQACTNREILIEIPYPTTDLKKKIGFEDWGWNIRTIEAGYLHKTIPNTLHAIRIKEKGHSLAQQTFRSGAIVAPNKLFRVLLKPEVSQMIPNALSGLAIK